MLTARSTKISTKELYPWEDIFYNKLKAKAVNNLKQTRDIIKFEEKFVNYYLLSYSIRHFATYNLLKRR